MDEGEMEGRYIPFLGVIYKIIKVRWISQEYKSE